MSRVSASDPSDQSWVKQEWKAADWVALRQYLHQRPELSNHEGATASFVQELIVQFGPDQVVPGLGGHGVAFVFGRASTGPTTLIRCELDGLPIPETGNCPYRSTVQGVGHQCGHDGHMTILAALAEDLGRRPPRNSRVVLLYQPAEETGEGAARVVADPAFAKLKPDYAFALHNVPGLALGEVAVKAGPINCASRGMVIRLKGHPSHAAHPESGRSPALAMSRIIPALHALPDRLGDGHWVTIVHAALGERSFGTAPGEALVMATLRSETDAGMATLVEAAGEIAHTEATKDKVEVELRWEDVFDASNNSELAASLIQKACRLTCTPCTVLDSPYRWSEDFGRLSAAATHGALLALGSGSDSPQIHNAHYDFPDALIPVGMHLFRQLIDLVDTPD